MQVYFNLSYLGLDLEPSVGQVYHLPLSEYASPHVWWYWIENSFPFQHHHFETELIMNRKIYTFVLVTSVYFQIVFLS